MAVTGTQVLQSFKHQLHRSKKIDFIEQFNEKLLIKQENENLQIIDVSRIFCVTMFRCMRIRVCVHIRPRIRLV